MSNLRYFRRGNQPPKEPPTIAGRAPRHDLGAEAAVLSAILIERDALDRVLEILRPEHFYSDANRRVYEGAEALAAAGTPIDIVSIASWLRAREWMGQIGGPSYLAQLADATPAVAHVTEHAMIVRELARQRQLVATCQRIAAEGYGDVGVVQEWIDVAESAIYDIARPAGSSAVARVNGIVREVFQQMNDSAARGHRIIGIPTGYDRLDAKLGGLVDGNVLVIAGRPGMAKTSVATCIAVNVASPRTVDIPDPDKPYGPKERRPDEETGVIFFSAEMPKEQLVARMVCAEARVDSGKVRENMLQAEDWRRLTEAASYISALPIFIDDSANLGLLEMRAKIRRLQAEYNRPATDTQPGRRIGCAIFDYLQILKAPPNAMSREQEVGENAKGLKQLAKELKIPVIVLSQLNRLVETRSTKDKRPQLSDCRDSGAIEEAADCLIGLYRDSYYNAETTTQRGIAELLFLKNRHGPTGKVLLRFDESCTRFDNLAPGEYEGMVDE